MKSILLSSFILLSVCSIGCSKKGGPRCQTTGGYSGLVQIVKDCTGTYIRYLDKDYRVCNEGLLKYYTDGSRATVVFDKASSCPDLPPYLCNMYHHHEGLVTISCIR